VTVEKGAVPGQAQAGASDELVYDDGRWMWIGERIRTTAEFSDDGSVQHALHEQSDDGVEWRLAMDVTLRRVD
jgi:hypothetical protein